MSSPQGLGQKASENMLRFCFQVRGKKRRMVYSLLHCYIMFPPKSAPPCPPLLFPPGTIKQACLRTDTSLTMAGM